MPHRSLRLEPRGHAEYRPVNRHVELVKREPAALRVVDVKRLVAEHGAPEMALPGHLTLFMELAGWFGMVQNRMYVRTPPTTTLFTPFRLLRSSLSVFCSPGLITCRSRLIRSHFVIAAL